MKFPPKSRVPSVEQCYALLKNHAVPPHIIEHSEMVATVAIFLAVELNNQGENLNIVKIEAAALLHDITKMECLETGRNHAKTGKEVLGTLGFERIGEIVGQHIRLKEEELSSRALSEEIIINYSDKRVMHTSVVSLVERFADLRKRYGGEKPGQDVVRRITELENETYEIEKKIFSKLDFSPEELAQLLNKTFLARDHYRHKGWH